jgi:hypothetical protein
MYPSRKVYPSAPPNVIATPRGCSLHAKPPSNAQLSKLRPLRSYSRTTMKLDPAVAELLRVDSEHATVSSAGGGGCSSASTAKITCKLSDGTEKSFFMKTGKGEDAEVMFAGTTQLPFFACTDDCARRTRVTQSHPRCRALPLSPVVRPRPLLLSVFDLVPCD